MSAQEQVKGWKAAAYAALSKYYAIEAERATFEERLALARVEAEKVGVSFEYNTPRVESADAALRCPCGTVIPLGYDEQRLARGTDGVLHCAPCREKTAAAVAADAKEEGRTPPPPKKTKASAEIPF